MQDERRGFGETSPRRPRTNGNTPRRTNGSRAETAHARPVPFHEVADEPIDLVAVQADDELISALAAGMTVSAPGYGGYDADDQVAAMLASWRAQVDAEPLPEMIDLDTATAAVLAASRPPARRSRRLVPLAAAAAIVVFSVGGVSIGASDARPGDTLWDVSRVLYSERAESVEAAERVEVRINEAKAALSRGEPAVAVEILATVEEDLVSVRAEEGLVELAEVQSFLEAKAIETPPGQVTDPGAPLAGDPRRPVPARAITPVPAPSQPALSPSADPAPPAVGPGPGTGPAEPVPSPGTPDEAGSPADSPAGPGPESSEPPAEVTSAPEEPPGGNVGGAEEGPSSIPSTGTVEGSPETTTTEGQIRGGSVRPDDEAGTPTASGASSSIEESGTPPS